MLAGVDPFANRANCVGFCCSISGLGGMIGGLLLTAQFGVSGVFHVLIAISLFSCAIGLAVSMAGIFFVPRRLAVWGALIGLLGSMNIQTFWLADMHSR